MALGTSIFGMKFRLWLSTSMNFFPTLLNCGNTYFMSVKLNSGTEISISLFRTYQAKIQWTLMIILVMGQIALLKVHIRLDFDILWQRSFELLLILTIIHREGVCIYTFFTLFGTGFLSLNLKRKWETQWREVHFSALHNSQAMRLNRHRVSETRAVQADWSRL